ncbi:MAG: UDP-N-acetylmuramoyl-L-alanine--D-glutamate ligase [Solobacterium sp.]|nr:UDP-N-acetylmuramoyl-L-alanine--D-glutamate ligase [Solobacterium sp.]
MKNFNWVKELESKKILLWGYGLEGKSSYRFLRSFFPEKELYIADQSEKEYSILAQTEYTYFVKEEEIYDGNFDLILKSPGIVVKDTRIPKEILSGQAPLFLKHYRDQVIGVTGTKGKSTTTSLIHAVLSQSYHTHLVGNIGKPCFDILHDLKDEDLVAFEISCHQLEYACDSPHVAVYLNLFEEHLDHYGSYEAYCFAKDQIFLHQKEEDILFIGKQIEQRAAHFPHVVIGKEIYADGLTMHFQEETCEVKETKLLGSHNAQNMAIAYAVGKLYGISDAKFQDAIASFQPLPHRLEYIGEKEGIKFIDDSISTIGQSCIQALEALGNTDTVLIGGMDRGIDYTELENYIMHHHEIDYIFMYATGKRIYEELKAKGYQRDTLHLVEDLEEAVALAKKLTRMNRYCLLSPAASSYDHFKNFEERGDVFRKLALEE